MRTIGRVIATLLFSGSFATQAAQTITLEDVMSSVFNLHPQLKAEQLKRQQAQFKLQQAQGAFDLQLEQKSGFRTSGFYNGRYIDQSASQPLAFANADIVAKYRISDGGFPVYEEINETLTGGEASLGIEFSLMRGFDTDKRRTGLLTGNEGLSVADAKWQKANNQLLLQSAEQFLSWYADVNRLNIINDLVLLATDRQTAIQTQIENGNLAAITATEFETTLLSRRTAAVSAMQAVQNSGLSLSWFWRDSEGQPLPVTPEQAPNSLPHLALINTMDQQGWYQSLVQQHPEVLELDGEMRIAKAELALAKNDLLPKLDVEVKLAQDVGSGSTTLNNLESFVGVSFSTPLQRTQAKAKRRSAKAKYQTLAWRRQAKVEQLELQFQAIALRLENLQQNVVLGKQRVAVSLKLLQQEQKRFEAGDSDLFRLNARERANADARLFYLQSEVNLRRQEIALLARANRLVQIVADAKTER